MATQARQRHGTGPRWVWVIAWAWLASSSQGQVVLRNGAAFGPGEASVSISENLGELRGANLFYAFRRLNVAAGQTVRFEGSSNVNNLFAYVSGGRSAIRGTLESTYPDANLYLINPRGVLIGPNAQININGSLVVSTASLVDFPDGRIDARDTPVDQSVFSAAEPTAFGFLGPAASVQIDRAAVGVLQQASSVSVIAGEVVLDRGRIGAVPDSVNDNPGEVRLVTAGPVATVTVRANDPVVPLGTDGRQGSVVLTGGSLVDVSNAGGGRVFIRTGRLVVDNGSAINAATRGGDPGRGIDIDARSVSLQRGGQVNSSTIGDGDGGDIRIVADALTIDPQGRFLDPEGTRRETAVGSQAGFRDLAGNDIRPAPSLTDGRPGAINLRVGRIQLGPGGFISVGTNSRGDSGGIDIRTRQFLADGGDLPYPLFTTGAEAQTSFTGRGGDLTVRGPGDQRPQVSLQRNARLSASTFGPASAGNVNIQARDLVLVGGLIDTRSERNPSFPDSAIEPTGSAGRIEIRAAGAITLRDGSAIDSLAEQGNAGRIDARAATTFDLFDSRITVEARQGRGGSIRLIAPFRFSAERSVVTGESGFAGGRITIDPQIVILNQSVINGLSNILGTDNTPPGGQRERVAIVTPVFVNLDSEILTDTPQSFPEADISSALPVFSRPQLEGVRLFEDVCRPLDLGDLSTLTRKGKGGVTPTGAW